jgi:superoxide reductase
MPEKGFYCGINKPKDMSAITDFEKKHTPVIECPDEIVAGQPFNIRLKVGEIPHVTETENTQ